MTGDDLPPDLPPGVGSTARQIRGCLPAALAGAVLIIAVVVYVFFGPDEIFGGDDNDAGAPATSATSTAPLPTPEPTSTTPTAGQTPTVDPVVPISMTGAFDDVGGEPVHGAFRNAIVLLFEPEGMSGEMNLVLDSKLNFDTEEPACFSVAVDLAKSPVEVRTTTDGGLVAKGPVTVVVGFTDGVCTQAPPARTETRKGSVSLTFNAGAKSTSGQLLVEDSPFGFTVSP